MLQFLDTAKIYGVTSRDHGPSWASGVTHSFRCKPKTPRSRRRNCVYASREDSADLLLWQQRRQLESLLRLSNEAAGEGASPLAYCWAHGDTSSNSSYLIMISSCSAIADQPASSSNLGTSQTLEDVPLWRIQTAVLPGSQVRFNHCT